MHYLSSIPICIRGLLLGLLIGGLALCVRIIPLWLTSTNRTTSTFRINYRKLSDNSFHNFDEMSIKKNLRTKNMFDSNKIS
jgi:hypothetical protein